MLFEYVYILLEIENRKSIKNRPYLICLLIIHKNRKKLTLKTSIEFERMSFLSSQVNLDTE